MQINSASVIIQLRNLNKRISLILGLFALLFLASCGSSKTTASDLSFKKSKKFDELYYKAAKYKIIEDYENAIKYFEEALVINPKSHAAHYELGLLYERKGEVQKSIASAQEAVDLNPEYNHWYYQNLASLLRTAGKYSESVAVLEEMLDNEPQNEEIYSNLVEQFIIKRSYNDAFRILDKMDKNMGMSRQSALQRRYIYALLGDYDKAIAAIQDLVDAYPKNEEYKVFLAESYVLSKNYKPAIAILEELTTTGTEEGQVWLLLAELYTKTSQDQKAFNCMKEAFAKSDIDLEKKIQTFSPYFLKVKKSDTARREAFELTDILLKAHEGEARPFVVRSDVYKLLDSFTLARKDLLSALEINSSDFRTWTKLLNIDGEIGDPQLQLQDADEAILYFPNIPSLFLAKAYAQYDLEQYKACIETAEEGLSIAIEAIDQLELYACKASAHDKLGEYSQSDLMFDKALRIDPNDVTTMNNYAYALAVRGERLEFADSLIDFALFAEPNNPYYLDTKAWVLFKMGKYEEAINLLNKAIQIDPLSSEYFEHLAEIYLADNNLEQARINWDKAKKLGSKNKELDSKLAL